MKHKRRGKEELREGEQVIGAVVASCQHEYCNRVEDIHKYIHEFIHWQRSKV